MQDFAAKLHPDIGPMFGRDVVRLIEAVQWYFSRRWGVSSEGLFLEAMGLPADRSFFGARPWDKGDSEGAEETFAEAPEWMRPLMQRRMDWYREIAALGWPNEAPARG